MPRLFFITILMVVIAGCNNERFVREHIFNVTPIANSESFYAIIETDTLIDHKYIELHSFVRIDSNAIIHVLKNLDTSFTTYKTTLLDDSTTLYDHFQDTTIRLYHIYSGKQATLLRGYRLDITSRNKKFFVTHDDSDIYAYTSFELCNDVIREIGHMRASGHMRNSYGDSGFSYITTAWVQGKGRNDSVVFSQPDFTPIRVQHIDSLKRNDYISDLELSEIPLQWLGMVFNEYHITFAYSLPDTNYLLIQGKTIKEYNDEARSRYIKKREEREKGNYIDYRAQEGYWMVADLRTKTLKKVGDEYWRPYFSSTHKTILFVDQDNDTYALKIVSVAEMLK